HHFLPFSLLKFSAASFIQAFLCFHHSFFSAQKSIKQEERKVSPSSFCLLVAESTFCHDFSAASQCSRD
ncbi:MAG TPA: hypothetical protein VFV38_53290, partial [Ktedonobacteraceae bacterium]|nr:hypothetical protein [Ktedonobacteraceae bacterium]